MESFSQSQQVEHWLYGSPNLFSEDFDFIGRVSMTFYIPQCPERGELVSVITYYGGKVINVKECYTIQLVPINLKISRSDFYQGEVFRATWITDSIKAGEKLDLARYLMKTFGPSEGAADTLRLFEVQCRSPYTLTEAFKVMEIAKANFSSRFNESCTTQGFWERQKVMNDPLPGRTPDSCRELLKKKFDNGRDFLSFFHSPKEKRHFSHFYAEIPRPKRNRELTQHQVEYIQSAPSEFDGIENNQMVVASSSSLSKSRFVVPKK